ncbi:MAG TPA: zinc ribbon domain-containing protein [Ktedonobacteraceae bacterium]|nr:zinc ribbon domain-containing protein [Ktedonobacteraceae bacterium]
MLRCQNCGTALPENARFCAQCGHALSVTMDTPTYSSNLMNSEGMMQPSTGGSGKEEEEEEQRRGMLLGWP